MEDRRLHRAVQHWVDLVAGLVNQPRGELPVDLILAELEETVGSPPSWAWRESDGTFGFVMHRPIPGWPAEEQLDSWGRGAMALHPLIRWFQVTGNLTATTLERVPRAIASDRDLGLTREHLLAVGLEQQLSVPYRQSATGSYRAFVLAKPGRDFDDHQVELCRRIQPLLLLLARQCAVTGEGSRPEQHAPRDPEQTTHPPGVGQPQVDCDPRAGAAVGVTGRELAVLRLLAHGMTAGAMARSLGISPRTVQVHLAHVYRKLGVNDRLLAVDVAREAGLLVTTSATAQARPEHPGPDRFLTPDSRDGRSVAWRPGQGTVTVVPRS